MSDEYLWDRSGPPDPAVKEIEAALASARYQPPAAPRAKPGDGYRRIAGLAAVLLLAILGTLSLKAMTPPARSGSFAVTRMAGTPICNDQPIHDSGRLFPGNWLETDAQSRAEVRVADIGKVNVAPGSRVRLVETGPQQHRLELARGEISARVSAPPRLFVVDTPSASAVDLGCAYSLAVNSQGATVLKVTWGMVSLEGNGRTATVPAGAECETRPHLGPGTPFVTDAPAALRTALASFDFDGGGEAALRDALAVARRKDAVSLWHLLSRVPERDRGEVFAKLAAFVTPPPNVVPANATHLAPKQLDQWWNKVVDDL